MEEYIYLKKTENEKIKIETSIENPLKYLKPIILLRVKNMDNIKNKLITYFNNKYEVDKIKLEYNGIVDEMIKDFIKICNEKFELIENEDNSFINKKIKEDNLYKINDDL
jgi:hypothetical protein